MSRPIQPNEVHARKSALPDEVLDVFNQLITERFDGHSATFTQDDAIALLLTRLNVSSTMAACTNPVTRDAIFDRHYLDVESVYRHAGWFVEYDKPGYNETYAATFTFRKPPMA